MRLDEEDDPLASAVDRKELDCPKCGLRHVDTLDEATGIDWATRPHKTHLCLHCGERFYPQETVRDCARIRRKLTRQEIADFQPLGQSFLVTGRSM